MDPNDTVTIDVDDVPGRLAELIQTAEGQADIRLSRDGEVVAVMVSVEQYERFRLLLLHAEATAAAAEAIVRRERKLSSEEGQSTPKE